ncbi:MAG TPA: hypothetical protein VHS36_10255 [Candidatus Limnocylindrales bacterium]|nr:hypothetical protein [Candidatus Limnocylindrales bacterium]
MRSTRRIVGAALGLSGLLALLTIGGALAQGPQLGGKLLTGSQITIPAGTTVDHDIYVFGGTLISNGTINGDIVAAAGTTKVNGPVHGDVLAAGGTITIDGPVTGDLRIAGGQVVIAGNVSDDVLAAGGEIAIEGHVGQDVIVSAGRLTLSGSVAGSAVGSTGTYAKTGSVAGTDSVVVTGDRAAALAPAANPVLDAIRQFVTVIVIALLLLWVAPRSLRASETEVREHPLPALGWGIAVAIGDLVLVVVGFIVMFLLAVALGLLGFDSLLAIVLFGGFVAVSGAALALIVAAGFLADAIVGLALVRAIAGRVGQAGRSPVGSGEPAAPSRDRVFELGLLTVGVAIVVLLTSVPVIGPWLKLAVSFLGLGGLWLAWRRPRQTAPGVRPTDTPTEGGPPLTWGRPG